MRVAILGGGLSGLVAAYEVQRQAPGSTVRLLEAAQRFGGVIHTERIGGYLLEHGADMLASQPDAALRLCRQLGLAERLIKPSAGARGAAIFDSGRLVRVPDGFVLMRPTRLWSMLTTPLLSPWGKLRLLAEPLVSKRTDASDESIASFVSRRLGPEVLERIVQPLVGGIYTGDVQRLSMEATMNPFRQMELQDGSLWAATRRRKRQGADSTERNSAGARYEAFRSLPGGLQELIDALAGSLPPEARCAGHRVTRVEPLADHRDAPGGETKAGRWRLWGRLGGAADELSERDLGEFDQLVIATPAAVAAHLLRPLAADVAQELSAIETASSAVVALGVRATDVTASIDVAGIVVPARQRRQILAASFTSDKFPGRAPEGEKLIRVFIGGVLQAELLQQDDDALIELARRELAEMIGLVGTPCLARVVRWQEAMPQYTVGHLQRIERIERGLRPLPGVQLIGNWKYGVGIAPTVAAAMAAAERLAPTTEHSTGRCQ